MGRLERVHDWIATRSASSEPAALAGGALDVFQDQVAGPTSWITQMWG